jgi:hypothetical protein
MDLNEPYMRSNKDGYQGGGAVDYFTQFSIPEEAAPSPPLAEQDNFYVNNSAPNINAPSPPSYLKMSPKRGVVEIEMQAYNRPDSPTIRKNLDTSPKHKKNVNKSPEEIPMLSKNLNGFQMNGDSDEEAQKGYTEMSFGNQNKKEVESEPEYKNLFNMNDNYVNVPAVNKSEYVANPSYIAIKNVNERLKN